MEVDITFLCERVDQIDLPTLDHVYLGNRKTIVFRLTGEGHGICLEITRKLVKL